MPRTSARLHGGRDGSHADAEAAQVPATSAANRRRRCAAANGCWRWRAAAATTARGWRRSASSAVERRRRCAAANGCWRWRAAAATSAARRRRSSASSAAGGRRSAGASCTGQAASLPSGNTAATTPNDARSG
jgi:hypothetical protein